ncbi:mRNA-capping enzyme-like isoform X2 [Zingiber officinale]|uniref:mRNA-capping enzyme-like isoform X2 n=1 Tax=Zingiber officinale TaxID=94328 RepID=UPI001C4BE696|nr:mRNA-capping enzyme-like isoform X2 [Zingiber officinale]
MDLNASPLPEEDERSYKEHLEGEIVHEEIIESAVATMRREREERRQKLKRENRDEGHKYSQQQRNNYMSQSRNTKHHGRVKEVPQGWLDCPSYGQCIGLIIPSKVPLDETYNESVLPGKRYSSKQVINKLRSQGRELGLVIDLTNTSRYYSQSEWIKIGIKHVKIPCKGRDSVPDNESVNIFVHEVLQFLSRMRHSKRYILVHCTHGHNRTGFMIIHFLMRTQRLHVSEALQRFAQARPPGIYKQDYVEALYKFYHECPENIVCPSTPEWKRSSDLDLNGEAVQDDDDDDDGDTGSGLCENVDIKILTNDDVLGDAIPYDQQDAMRHLCYQFLDLMPPTGRTNPQFPGSHPVSLNRDNLQLLRQRYYYATWKADGTRYMMFINSKGCYLIDRNFCFRRVQMRFPLKNAAESFHNDTLIDGEMIIDQIPDVGQKRRYLAYDLVALNGFSVMKLPFSERWKLLEEEVIRPRNYERKQLESDSKGHPIYRYDMEPFSVRRKDFWFLSTVTKLLKEFIPRLSHEADGLIFQGWDDPYIPRTHEGLLKWKYPEMNSVDFLFEVGSENRQMLFLYERGKKKLMDEARVSFPGVEDALNLSGKIVECSWDQEEGCWTCMRIRTDKSTPNDINTYRKASLDSPHDSNKKHLHS